jgi:hypothetical protein
MISSYALSRVVKVMKTKSRMMVFRSWEEGEENEKLQ